MKMKSPHKLLDHLIAAYELRSDAALARLLQTNPSYICKVRNGTLAPGAELVLRVHEVTDMPVKDIKELLA